MKNLIAVIKPLCPIMLLIYPNNFTNRLYYYFDILLFDVFSIFSSIYTFLKKSYYYITKIKYTAMNEKFVIAVYFFT